MANFICTQAGMAWHGVVCSPRHTTCLRDWRAKPLTWYTYRMQQPLSCWARCSVQRAALQLYSFLFQFYFILLEFHFVCFYFLRNLSVCNFLQNAKKKSSCISSCGREAPFLCILLFLTIIFFFVAFHYSFSFHYSSALFLFCTLHCGDQFLVP